MPRTARRKPLSRERIINTALKLIDRGGLEKFSARKLGAALKVEAMSLYHHFPSQAHLLDAIMDKLVSELPNPLDLPRGPQRMRTTFSAYRDLAQKHPRFIGYVIMHRWNSAATLRFLEGLLSLFAGEGFDAEMAVRIFRVVGYFLNGCALEENAVLHVAAEPVTLEEQRVRFPLVYAAAPWFQGHRDDAFELGMDLLLKALDGLPRRAPANNRKPKG